MFDTPILFIIFNRPDTTQLVFNAIKKIQPKYLFVAADGPRPGNANDVEKCKQTRAIIEQVDWNCELKTLFRTENVGCGRGPAGAISWFFENVEEGIILEDDCVPNDDFFVFMPFILQKYKEDNRISLVIGTNFLGKWKSKQNSYFFSNFAHTWGWATWRRAWINYDFELKDWNSDASEFIRKRLSNKKMHSRLSELFSYTKENIETVTWWDYQWLFCMQISNGLCIVPTVNLVRNIGFDENATHTKGQNEAQPMLNNKYEFLPIHENNSLNPDRRFDLKYFRKSFLHEISFWKKVRRFLKNRYNKYILRRIK